MKKVVLVLAILALTSAAVFAEITFSGNGRAVFVPFGARFGDPVETVAGSEVSYSDAGPRIQLVVDGTRETGNMGFKVGVNLDADGFGLDDNAKVWIKPAGWFKITLGKFVEDDLRYKIGVSGGGFHNHMLYIRGNNLDEDAFFSRFKSGGFGTHFSVTPIDDLYIGAAVGSTFGSQRSFRELREYGAEDVYANAQIGIGYKIPNIGFARFMFNGQNPTHTDDATISLTSVRTNGFAGVGTGATHNAPTFQAAFQLTAVKGLNIDIGGQIPLLYEDKTVGSEKDTQYPYIAGLGFDYTLPPIPLRLYGRVSEKFGGYTQAAGQDKVYDGNDFVLFLTPMYTVAPNWIVGFEFALDIQAGSDYNPLEANGAKGGDTDKQYVKYWNEPSRAAKAADLKDNYTDLGLGLYVRHNIAGGDIRIAAAVKLPGGEAHEGAKPQLAFPIMFNYNF